MQKPDEKKKIDDVEKKSAAIAKRKKREDKKKAEADKKEAPGKFGKFGKIMEDGEKCILPGSIGRFFARSMNLGYNVFRMVTHFSRSLMWFGSCIAFMWVFPITFELFQEQQKILMKL